MSQEVVRVLPDEPGLAKTFDYLVPEALGDQVRVGTKVRVPLGRRRVGGWVLATGIEPPVGVTLRPLAKVSGIGPPADILELADWASWRWAGPSASFLRTASPPRNVASLPPASSHRVRPDWTPGPVHELARQALLRGQALLRLPPGCSPLAAALVACWSGNTLVLCPTAEVARSVARGLRAEGVPVASYPQDWALGAAGATVVGTRAAAWAPVGDLAAVVVLDEHDEGHAQEQSPTWHARDVAVERARRAGVPCLLVSPCPSLEALAWGELVTPGRQDERRGWPIVDVLDRRDDDPRTGLYASRLVESLRRSQGRAVCVLNRTGRARLLACAACGELAACEACEAAVTQPEDDQLACPRCGATRPVVCTACGATRLKVLRQGVTRAREELQALLGEPVGELTGTSTADDVRRAPRVVVGTEAVLHHVHRAEVVAFLDLDQELLAPRYRAVEQAMGLVARAARCVGGKDTRGRLMLQTRLPRHEVVLAALHADPSKVAQAEAERRELLQFPPATALAEVSGAAAGELIAALGNPLGVDIMGPADGAWLLRAPNHQILCDSLASVPRPKGRLRVAVDPLRV